MLIDEEDSVEVKVWIKDDSVRKVFIKSIFKTLPIIFAVMFGYFLYSFGFMFLGISDKSSKSIAFVILVVFILASAVAVLYAVGSGFQKVSELEKASPKTRIIFRQTAIEFIKVFDSTEKQWTELRKIKETVDGFRVYPTNAKSFFINHYAFETRQNILKFRGIVAKQLGEKAKLRND